MKLTEFLVWRNRMTDAQLIDKFLNGHVSAFNTLVWRWEKSLYNFVLRYMGDREEAKDICQKSFIRAYKKLGHLQEPEKFSTWLYQIAVNICRDELKRRKRRTLFSLDAMQANENGVNSEIAALKSDGKSNPEAVAENRNAFELIRKALQEIPEEQRVVIIMKEYQGLKFTEIAEVLEISVNTTKSRMYYGLSALRKVFNKWEISEEMLNYEL